MGRKKLKTICGIYCIKNNKNNKRYIGKSKNTHKRILLHLRELKTNTHENSHFQNSWNKYGEENFEVFILKECSEKELNETEIYYIKKFNTRNSKYGYNKTTGGDGGVTTLGMRHTEASKQKIRDKMRDQRREKNVNWGVHPSEETRKKRSLAMKKYIGEYSNAFGKKRKNSSSKYFGVSISYNKKTIKGKLYDYIYYTARITYKTKKINIGVYKSEKNAAKEYDRYIIENNLPHPLNFKH